MSRIGNVRGSAWLGWAGYSKTNAGASGFPLLFLNDGQNLFDDRMSLSGNSWRVAETCAHLITSGQLPTFVVVGIDHAGALRAWDYNPYPPGTPSPGSPLVPPPPWPPDTQHAPFLSQLSLHLPLFHNIMGFASPHLITPLQTLINLINLINPTSVSPLNCCLWFLLAASVSACARYASPSPGARDDAWQPRKKPWNSSQYEASLLFPENV